MKTTKEKFLTIVSNETTSSLERTRVRVKNKETIRESQYIALKVLDRLEKLGWSQKKLALEMQVSPQQIHKIVRGSENLTLETLVKLQNVLAISLLASHLEKQAGTSNTNIPLMINTHEDEFYFKTVKHNIAKAFNSCDFHIQNDDFHQAVFIAQTKWNTQPHLATIPGSFNHSLPLTIEKSAFTEVKRLFILSQGTKKEDKENESILAG